MIDAIGMGDMALTYSRRGPSTARSLGSTEHTGSGFRETR